MKYGIAGVFLLMACGDPRPQPPATEAFAWETFVEPEAPLDSVHAVSRLRIEPFEGEMPRLFHGQLGAYHLARLRKGDVPGTLLERELPLFSWQQGGALNLAPSEVLSPGESYSVADQGRLLCEFTVREEPGVLLTRYWPPAGESHDPWVAYCGDEPLDNLPTDIQLQPSSTRARVQRGLAEGCAEDACVVLRVEPGVVSPGVVIPPPRVGAYALDPSPWQIDESGAPSSTPCESGELKLGVACALTGEDRLGIRAGPEGALVVIRRGERCWYHLVEEERTWAKVLEPDSRQRVEVFVVDEKGRPWSGSEWVETPPARARVVITEVLADAIGAEPAQEWVELYNDGTLAARLDGYVLQDSTGETPLPSRMLFPGQYALVVGEAFDPQPPFDLPPAPGTDLLVVASVGQGGLKNTGEALRLIDAQGAIASEYPAHPAPAAGTSWARRSPEAADDAPSSFAAHGSPGASPGGPNVFDDGFLEGG